MYIETKTISGKKYLYLKESHREGKRVATRTVAYLGKSPLPKIVVQKRIAAFMLKETSKKEKIPPKEITALLLDAEQVKKLKSLQQDFAYRLKKIDKALKEDMFRDFKTNYIYNTNAIEGNTLTLEETNMVVNDKKTPAGKDLREIYDHLNAKETFDYLLKNKPEINLKSIIDIHARLLKNIDARVGAFRRHDVRIVGADFKPTEAQYVYTDMNLLLKWYKKFEKKLHPLIVAAIFHEKFERIHPFYDGNGRTGRMLLNLMLLKSSFPPLVVSNAARKEYYLALSEGHKAGLTAIEPQHYKRMIQFCYLQLCETYEKIFSQWG